MHHRSLTIITGLAAILLSLASWLAVDRIAANTRKDMGESLTTVLATTQQAIRTWANQRRAAAQIWANTAETKRLTTELLATEVTPEALINSPAQAEIRNWLRPGYSGKGRQGFFIIGPGNIGLASSRDINIGVPNLLIAQENIIQRMWSGQTAVSLPQRSVVPLPAENGILREGQPTMFVGAPIRDESGSVMAILTFRINPREDFIAIFQRGRLGVSGETYAFDKRGRLISESRFDDHVRESGLVGPDEKAMLNVTIRDPGVDLTKGESSKIARDRQPLTRMAASAVAGESGTDLEGYRDYRGVTVIGAWLWDSELNLGVTTEIDVSQAYRGLYSIKYTIFALTVFSILLLVGVTIISIIGRKHLFENEQRLRQIIDLVPNMIYAKDGNGRFLLANKAVAEAHKTTPKELIKASQSMVQAEPDDGQAQLADTQIVIASGKRRVIPEDIFVDDEGNRLILETVKIPYVAALRNQPAVLTVATDITERKQAEQALAESEARKSAILDSALDCIIAIDKEGQIIDFNPAAEKVFGYKAVDAVGQKLTELIIPAKYREAHRKGLQRYLTSGTSKILGKQIEIQALRADGSQFPVELAITPMIVNGQPAYTGFLRDLTRRKATEAQLQQAQKMEAVGHLTGGIAHDFNNLLTVILGNLDLLEGSLEKDSEEYTTYRGVVDAVLRGADLIKRLLAFSRRQVLEPRVVDVNQLVSGMKDLLRRTLGNHIEIDTYFEDDLWRTTIDPGQLENALLNLSVNARDGMPSGGKLTIGTGNAILDDTYAAEHADLSPGDYVMVTVSDNGTGIPADMLSKVFDPFFSTKAAGKGSGLGLSMVYGFVKQSGGHINIYSEEGLGTSVKLYLPKTKSSDRLAPQKTADVDEEIPVGHETILVVEDDPALRQLAVRLLHKLEYRTVTAENGPAALAIIDSHEEIDLLFTDMVMHGGISGPELAEAAKRRLPALKVLYTSGYTEDDFARAGVSSGEIQFIGKPYTKERLARKIRHLLDKA